MHRRLLLVPALALAACDAGTHPTATADVTPSAIASPVVASVSGGGHWFTFDGFLRRLAFSARRHADGTLQGEWQLVVSATILHGTITCMHIDGNVARVGGTVDQSKFSLFQVGTDVGWYVVDDGEGSGAQDATSHLRAFRNSPPGTAQRFCDTGEAPVNVPQDVIALGNVQVRGE